MVTRRLTFEGARTGGGRTGTKDGESPPAMHDSDCGGGPRLEELKEAQELVTETLEGLLKPRRPATRSITDAIKRGH